MIEDPKLKLGSGTLIVAALPGDYGKPRPALIVQNDILHELQSVVLCPITSNIQNEITHMRVTIEPNQYNGLKVTSQIMIDKITSISKSKIGEVIGHADETTMQRVSQGLMVLLKLM
jgi:mRNA interferase MazF